MPGIVFNSILIVGFVIIIASNSETVSIRNNTVRNYFIRLQPELDVIDIEGFVKKDYVLRFQLKCLLNNDTYCDPIGRWLAPRLPFMLLGQCPKCTDVQKVKIADGLNYVRREYPNIYQALVDRYIVQDSDEGEEHDQKLQVGTIEPVSETRGQSSEGDSISIKSSTDKNEMSI